MRGEHLINGTRQPYLMFSPNRTTGGKTMGKGILLWLLGIPIPIIILILLIWH
jgi:hypothetical protein